MNGIRGVAVVSALVSGLSACTLSAPAELRKYIVSADDLALDDAVAAFVMGRQAAGYTGNTGNGYVVLIGESGEPRVFPTAGMDNGQLDWNDHGLVFADTEYDYLLDEKLTKVASPKTNYQQAMHVLDDGTSVALYNDGFTDDGYVEQLVATANDTSALHEVEGYYAVTGLCDGVLYGLAEPLGEYAPAAESEGLAPQGGFGFTALMLSRLSPVPEGRESVVGISGVDDSEQGASDAPCADDTLYHFATRYDSEGNGTPVVRQWDIMTGAVTQHDITSHAVSDVLEGEYGFEIEGLSRHSLQDGKLDWVSTDGRVLRTNPDTGSTEELFTLDNEGFDVSSSVRSIEFTPTRLVTLTTSADGTAVTYTEYDRFSGERLLRHDLSALADPIIDGGLVIRDVAARPDP